MGFIFPKMGPPIRLGDVKKRPQGLSMKLILRLVALYFSIFETYGKELKPIDFYLFFGRKEVSPTIFPKGALKYQDIKSWKFNTYEEFLDQLNFHKPQFYENEVLIHSSSSLQPSSLDAPRVLLFGEGVVMAFSEEKSLEERRVEMVEFDRKEARFIPREIKFDGEQVTFNDQPTSCRACHGQPFRPIWNPYDFWARAYGSRIGRLGSDQELAAYHHYFEDRSSGIRRFLKKDAVPEGDHFFLNSIEAFTGYMNTLNSMTMGKFLAQQELGSFKYPLQWILNNCGTGT